MPKIRPSRFHACVFPTFMALFFAGLGACDVPSQNSGDLAPADSNDSSPDGFTFDWGTQDLDVQLPDFKDHDVELPDGTPFELLDQLTDGSDAADLPEVPDSDVHVDADAPNGDLEAGDVDDDADVEVVTKPEICNGEDDDGDGEIDEGLLLLFQADADLDGFGDPYNTVKVCEFGLGVSTNKQDCDDTNPLSYPGAAEICDDNDNDCDGAVDEDLGVTVCGLGPCNHLEVNCINGILKQCDPYKGAQLEVCDGTDNDCDGTIDDGVLRGFFKDADGDGFGDAASQVFACLAPVGTSTNGEDCDDTHASVWPAAPEICDGLDNNCNGAFDEDIPDLSCGLGLCTHLEPACEGGLPGDCDPMLGAAEEVCDGMDNDCDGLDDDGVLNTYFRDEDGDLVGLTEASVLACVVPDGYVAVDGDCDDVRADAWPGAPELCNGLDDDCDAESDEELPDLVCGLGVCLHSVVACIDAVPQSCEPMAGATLETCDGLDNDCDGVVDQGFGSVLCGLGACQRELPNCLDGEPSVCDPMDGALPETCDGQDNNCDGMVDEALGQTMCGQGLCEHTVQNCEMGVPQTCEPFEGALPEQCDGFDNDCNGVVDEGIADLVCGLGVCAHSVAACVGAETQTCDPMEGALVEQCDGLDNDCDGLADEEMPLETCGLGQCAHQIFSCLEGIPQTCDPMQGSAAETCDGLDNDCDGVADDGVMPTWYRDEDDDSFGDPTRPLLNCQKPQGYVANNLDCNDLALTIRPGAVEVCDGKDQDCDGDVDEGVLKTYYLDADNDGYGAVTAPVLGCILPAGASALSSDCDDTDKNIKPGGVEVCDGKDQDCDGTIDDGVLATFYRDADGDGYGVASPTTQACTAPPGYVFNKNDCNDTNASVYPSAIEICDTLDNDCDGGVDEGVKITFYLDADGDGYGVPTSTVQACSLPAGYATVSGDCNDARPDVRPGQTEVCDGVDNDCDGGVDEAVKILFYRDADNDGFGTYSPTTLACTKPAGYADNFDDCDDTNGVSYPGATEVCDGTDNDCDGQVDEGVRLDFYRDSDSDSFGDLAVKTKACTQPTGYVTNSTDCNDNRANVFPGALEVCDYMDNNCDSSIDEGVLLTFYRDSDLDTFGNPANTTQGCSAITGYIAVAGDCDDSKAAVNPSATEICDGMDNDCDSLVDEGVLQTFYRDSDYDGYGVDTTTLTGCSKPTGYALVAGDCNDAIGAIRPGAAEACDSTDNDCDQVVDEDWGVAIISVQCGLVTVRNTGLYALTSFGVLVDGNVVASTGIDSLPAGESGTLLLSANLDGSHTLNLLAECSSDSTVSSLSCP